MDYLSTLAAEFSLQNIFSILSIMFSISSKLKQPSAWLWKYLRRGRSGRICLFYYMCTFDFIQEGNQGH